MNIVVGTQYEKQFITILDICWSTMVSLAYGMSGIQAVIYFEP